jgi:hypothetical protein
MGCQCSESETQCPPSQRGPRAPKRCGLVAPGFKFVGGDSDRVGERAKMFDSESSIRAGPSLCELVPA